ncbi:carbohydrate-binding protein [Chitinophaga agri]|uniref:Chitin-binding type-3 domain-containing protein n=1 Tax=Chitinophaga agri TaxID=2703787 RepID=A0A6B9ZDJ7_9BACT|nr:carbohydrate-binding protein [Chitinophaga agri]QHS59829.1 hypothetical protein GWR21_09565 [Chitinophaga agri]
MKMRKHYAVALLMVGITTPSITTLKAGNNVTPHSVNQTFDLCSETAAWVSATAYVMGSYVKYNGRLFRARSWTQGDTPRGFGVYPDGPWEDQGTCF